MRSEKLVARLFQVCCLPCKRFIPAGRADRGRCELCGCRVNLKTGLNKLRWATESCPDTPPKFLATVDENGQPITKEETDTMSRLEKTGEARSGVHWRWRPMRG